MAPPYWFGEEGLSPLIWNRDIKNEIIITYKGKMFSL